MAVAARRMEIGANARNNGMPAGRAVTYAVVEPRMEHIRGPQADPTAWPPPGGARRGIG